MGKVQLENGFTRIANEILEAITISKFNGTQLKIVLCVIRRTYGFQKKESDLSITFISRATGISKRYIAQEINNLITSKVLLVTKEHTIKSSRRLKLNKSYQEWETYRSTLPQMKNTSTGEEHFHTPIEADFHTPIEADFHQKRNKETYKEMAIDFSSSPTNTKKPYDEYFEKIWAAYPNKKGKSLVSAKQKLKLYNEVPEEQMLQAIDKYKQETKGFELRFIKHGSTWFNGGYEDYIEAVKTPPVPKKEPVYRDYHEKMAELEAAELERLRNMPKIKIVSYDEVELRREKHDYNQRT